MRLEMISAGQNLREDYLWLANLDPAIIQGLLTLLSASVAALVALYIAKKIYPIQKDKDREIKIDEEKRAVYRDFLKNIDGLLNQRLLDTQVEKMRAINRVKASLNEVSIFAHKDTADAMRALYVFAALLSNRLSNEADFGSESQESYAEELENANMAFRIAINAARIELGVAPLENIAELAILTSRPNGD
ncbi:hypothetical protein [Sulfitobacter sp. R18_1]|uniref:hypothetical protein n=1 Tax=Sulfitobacter sp. R18_1 TaxID=2821104 RepID=UPI001ADBD9CF|nr:hypothetical protein [Sulfitobacter sp. R18_1]MBO9428954.1 hypothetical protein [Sulfitobacter sp. R18_1]